MFQSRLIIAAACLSRPSEASPEMSTITCGADPNGAGSGSGLAQARHAPRATPDVVVSHHDF
jgi:hypothetical protein